MTRPAFRLAAVIPKGVRRRLAGLIGTGGVRTAREAAQVVYLAALQGPGSPWPVDTGFSKAGFYWDDEQLHNVADYAPYVEERTGAAEEVLRATERVIVGDVNAEVQGWLNSISL